MFEPALKAATVVAERHSHGSRLAKPAVPAMLNAVGPARLVASSFSVNVSLMRKLLIRLGIGIPRIQKRLGDTAVGTCRGFRSRTPCDARRRGRSCTQIDDAAGA